MVLSASIGSLCCGGWCEVRVYETWCVGVEGEVKGSAVWLMGGSAVVLVATVTVLVEEGVVRSTWLAMDCVLMVAGRWQSQQRTVVTGKQSQQTVCCAMADSIGNDWWWEWLISLPLSVPSAYSDGVVTAVKSDGGGSTTAAAASLVD